MRISDWSSDVCSSDLDVVAGAVEDAVDAVDAVGGEALAQALDDGNAAGHRGLVADGSAAALGQRGKRGAVVREQRLFGGDPLAPGAPRLGSTAWRERVC